MDLIPYALDFKPGWDRHFKGFDKGVQQQILKKFEQMKQPLQSRGLHSLRYQVEEVGQHRIAFEVDERARTKSIYFIGNHKQYEKWYKNQQ